MNIGYQSNAQDVAYATKEEETIYDQASRGFKELEYAIQRLEEALKRVMRPAPDALAVAQETKVPVSVSSEHKEWFKSHSHQIKRSTDKIQEIIGLLDIQ